jgi:hypothetical protein
MLPESKFRFSKESEGLMRVTFTVILEGNCQIAKISWMSLDKVTKTNNFKGAGVAEASGRAIAKRAT